MLELTRDVNYLYGYWCGHSANPALLREVHGDPDFLMGVADGMADFPARRFVMDTCTYWADLDRDGLIVGQITIITGVLDLYYQTATDDPIPDSFWQWDSTKYRSSGGSRGWQFIPKSAILTP